MPFRLRECHLEKSLKIMPQELTPEQRLTQIEKLLESAVKLSHSNTDKIAANSDAIHALTDRMDTLTDQVDTLTDRMDTLTDRVDTVTEQIGRAIEIFVDSMGVMREMQNEIKGLQIENRRILDYLFGQENQK
jgi:uncharacterized coiled-coil DUF342 family protein